MLVDHPPVIDIRGLPPHLQVRVSNTNETIRRQPAILLMTSMCSTGTLKLSDLSVRLAVEGIMGPWKDGKWQPEGMTESDYLMWETDHADSNLF